MVLIEKYLLRYSMIFRLDENTVTWMMEDSDDLKLAYLMHQNGS